jgi:hypothetical protein
MGMCVQGAYGTATAPLPLALMSLIPSLESFAKVSRIAFEIRK